MSIFKRIVKQDVEIAKYRQSVKCNWCGRLVFYSDKEEFKYRLMKEMKRKK